MVEVHRVQAAAILYHDGIARVAHDGRVREDLAEKPCVLALIAGLLA